MSLGRVEILILFFARDRKDVYLAVVGGHDQILGTDHSGGIRAHIPALPRRRCGVRWWPRRRQSDLGKFARQRFSLMLAKAPDATRLRYAKPLHDLRGSGLAHTRQPREQAGDLHHPDHVIGRASTDDVSQAHGPELETVPYFGLNFGRSRRPLQRRGTLFGSQGRNRHVKPSLVVSPGSGGRGKGSLAGTAGLAGLASWLCGAGGGLRG